MKTTDTGVIETAAATASNMASELSKTMHAAGELGSAATRLADQTIHDKPWRAVAVAAGIGFLLGMLARGRR